MNTNNIRFKTGEIPRKWDFVRSAKSAAWPEGRNGQIERVNAIDAQINPGRVVVRWSDRSEKSHGRSRISPAQLELVRCGDCSEDNFMTVSDGHGGVEYDACPRCYRAVPDAEPESDFLAEMAEIEF